MESDASSIPDSADLENSDLILVSGDEEDGDDSVDESLIAVSETCLH